ncbi:MAG: RpiB/LacA/LacB family sugar-phosphate isomerase, partial [Candidatus Sumerlaeia bacterium]|nr:RpiB/LacA/LacB family sugar-phosphate isomerase [Candidatus Sumerlaeia bacterium]
FGIILCRSGIGMTLVANRYSGVRAALVTSPDTARLCRTHNNANVFVYGSDHNAFDCAELVEVFLASEFEGGRHARRVDLIHLLDTPADSLVPMVVAIRHGELSWLQGNARDINPSLIGPNGFHGVILENFAPTSDSVAIRGVVEALERVQAAKGNRSGFLSIPYSGEAEKLSLWYAGFKNSESGMMANVLIRLQFGGSDYSGCLERAVSSGIGVHVCGVGTTEDLQAVLNLRNREAQNRLDKGLEIHDSHVFVEIDSENPEQVALPQQSNGLWIALRTLAQEANYGLNSASLNRAGLPPVILCFRSNNALEPFQRQSVRIESVTG